MLMFEDEPSPKFRTQDKANIVSPTVANGGEMWRVARDSGDLDLNSSYMYLLFARDFARTCRVALVNDEVVAFVVAYRRAEDPTCLFVWQIAVDENHRGEGLAGRLLDDVIVASRGTANEIRTVETTITEANVASRQLFSRFAQRWSAPLQTSELFVPDHFPDSHDAELLHLIGPIGALPRD